MKKPVYFNIPLASKRDPASWKIVTDCLSHTLRSILNQSDPDFVVFVCSHDKPDCPEMLDQRVRFIKASGPRAERPEDFTGDKGRKRRTINREIAKLGAGYVVMHDGDDLLHRELVEYFRTTDDPNGYYYPSGYAMDYVSKDVAPIPGVWSGPFNTVCGSSAAFWLRPEDILPKKEPTFIKSLKQHSQWANVAAQWGRPLAAVPFPCCIYMQNNSVNISLTLQNREHRMPKITASITRLAVPRTAELVRDFSLDWTYDRPHPEKRLGWMQQLLSRLWRAR